MVDRRQYGTLVSEDVSRGSSIGSVGASDPALERHYSVYELTKLWGLSERTVRRIFSEEPGVVKWGSEERRYKRAYVTLRIPETVVQRVHRRLSSVAGS
jgi:transcriptional regulator GlxA family with amidase domain